MNFDYKLSHTDSVHTNWDSNLKPALSIESGEVVQFDCVNALGNDITPKTSSEELKNDKYKGHHLTGPIEVSGAKPGDVLQIDLMDVECGNWGYTFFRSGDTGSGLLSEEYPNSYIYHWDLHNDVAEFENDIRIPLEPFPGCIGVAPAIEGSHSTVPPRSVGGNMDVKYLTSGSTVYLPVAVDGALFSIGDGHAAQGDGEVCVSAIETSLNVVGKFTLHSDMPINSPSFTTPNSSTTNKENEEIYATTGISNNLENASKNAIYNMIEYLYYEKDLDHRDGYILCSVAADLKINEIVNRPNWVVSANINKSIF